ncbi:MAG: hypothetical protein H7831_04015 [Magnetococcus sp. WYHC-3]
MLWPQSLAHGVMTAFGNFHGGSELTPADMKLAQGTAGGHGLRVIASHGGGQTRFGFCDQGLGRFVLSQGGQGLTQGQTALVGQEVVVAEGSLGQGQGLFRQGAALFRCGVGGQFHGLEGVGPARQSAPLRRVGNARQSGLHPLIHGSRESLQGCIQGLGKASGLGQVAPGQGGQESGAGVGRRAGHDGGGHRRRRCRCRGRGRRRSGGHHGGTGRLGVAGALEPFLRFHRVGGDPVAPLVHQPQVMAGPGVAVFGGLAKQAHRFAVGTRGAQAHVVQHTQTHLGLGHTGLGGPSIPGHGLPMVFREQAAFEENVPQGHHGRGVSGFGQRGEA